MTMRCGLCKNEAPDSVEFECGPGANYSIDFPLCDDHFAEYDLDEYAFQDKYAEQILEGLYENWRGMADAREDR